MVDQTTVVQVNEAARGPRGDPLAAGDYGDVSVAGGLYTLNPNAPNIFNKVQHCANRTELKDAATGIPAFLHEGLRAGLFVFIPTDLAAATTADTQEGVYIASNVTPVGAWARADQGPLRPHWFGALGDGVTNDQPAFDGINSLTAYLGYAHIQLQHGAVYLIGGQLAGANGWNQYPISAINAVNLSSFLLDLNGATLKTVGGLKFGRFDAVTGAPLGNYVGGTCPTNQRARIGQMVYVENVPVVSVVNGVLDGNSPGMVIGGKTSDDGWQEAHTGLFFRRCNTVYVKNVEGFNYLLDGWNYDWELAGGGDGIAIGDPARPFVMENTNFHNVGRNCGTIGGGNAITLINPNHRHGGAPVSSDPLGNGSNILVSGPSSGLDIESTSIIRNVRIFGGSFVQGAVGSTAIVADSGDTENILLKGTLLVGTVWLAKPYSKMKNCHMFGVFGALYSAGSAGISNAVIDGCTITDETLGDTPLQGPAGGMLLTSSDGITISNTSFKLTRTKLDVDGVISNDITVTVTLTTDSIVDKDFFMLARSGGIFRRWKIIDAIPTGQPNTPTNGFYVSRGGGLFEDCNIISASGLIKWGTWGAIGYAGVFSSRALPVAALDFNTHAGASLEIGQRYGKVTMRFNDVIPTDAPSKGTITFNEVPAAGSVIGWRLLTDGVTHEPMYALRNAGLVAAVKAAASSSTYVAPGTTYVAPSGGTTVDTQARASLAQLATDVAAIKNALAQVAADRADLKAKLAAAGLIA